MRDNRMKEKVVSPEEAMKQIQRIFKKRGTHALEMARKEILQEQIESREVKRALNYFMRRYWHDVTRPALLSFACEAVGGKPEKATIAAIPMILTSGAIDIHDDIIDQSKIKGVNPTVLGKFGKDIALLAGDALLFKGLLKLNHEVLGEIPMKTFKAVFDVLQKTFFELGDAEALELDLRRRIDVTPEEYLHVLEKKAADVEGYIRIGALLGGGTCKEIEALGRYGRLLGMLIILRDDLIDIMDLKEAQHRFKKECLPLPILYALQNPWAKSKMSLHLRKKSITQKDAESIIENAKKAGGVKLSVELMQKWIKEADQCIKDIRHNKHSLELLIHATTSSL